MLQYPSIVRWKDANRLGEPCIGFYKYDGSNLRWEWNPKRGWNKYGTRKTLFDKNTPFWNQAIPMFKETIADVVEEQVRYHFGRKVDRIVAFTEFFGPSSFAGAHNEEEEKQLVLFDVSVYKQGFLPPKTFLKLFSHHNFCAKVVYQGIFDQQLIDDVRTGKYPVYEGIVCKGDGWSTKIKTIEYLTRLRAERQGLKEEEYDE